MRCFTHNRDGIAAIEFAFAMPVLLLLALSGFEMSRLLLIHQKADRVAYTVTDTVAQSTSVTNSQLAQTLSAAAQIMQPFTFDSDGAVIVSSVYQSDTNPPVVRWQYTGGGSLARASRIGVTGGNAALPGGLILNNKDNVIVAEVFYRFSPVFAGNIVDPHDIYKTVVFKPRLGALTTPPN